MGSRIAHIATALVVSYAAMSSLPGCNKSESSGSASAAAPASAGPMSKDAAVNEVRAELEKHWAKSSNGWATQYVLDDGSPFYKEMKNLNLDLEPSELSEEDKKEGYQYIALAKFTDPQTRFTIAGKWKPWISGANPFFVRKQNGAWQISDRFDFVNREPRNIGNGTKPDAATLAKIAQFPEG
jgi:hypothetical protein